MLKSRWRSMTWIKTVNRSDIWSKRPWDVWSWISLPRKTILISIRWSRRKLCVTLSVTCSNVAVWTWRLNSWMILRIWVIVRLLKEVCLSIWETLSFLRTSRTCCKKDMIRLRRWWRTITWDSLPIMKDITRLLIFGHTWMRTWPPRWWNNWQRTTKDSILSIWCWIPEPVDLVSRFVSWEVCVDWWQNRRNQVLQGDRLSRTRFWQTLKRDFRCWSTLFRPTVLVKVWPIPHWRLLTPDIWLVVWLTWLMTSRLPRKIAVRWEVSPFQRSKITRRSCLLCQREF